MSERVPKHLFSILSPLDLPQEEVAVLPPAKLASVKLLGRLSCALPAPETPCQRFLRAPSQPRPSTKNKDGKRDPEMRQSKKGNQWYFGMKAHVGVDARSGLVHIAGMTTGKVHDAKEMDTLIREDDRAVFGDKGYVNEKKKGAARAAGVY